MITKEKMRLDVKWATRQRLQYIEIMAWYAGVVTRSMSSAPSPVRPAATKDLKLYSDLAWQPRLQPQRVRLRAGRGVCRVFADLAPAAVLPIIAPIWRWRTPLRGRAGIRPTDGSIAAARPPARPQTLRRSPAPSMDGAGCA